MPMLKLLTSLKLEADEGDAQAELAENILVNVKVRNLAT